jgi:hypothetical protein
MRRAVWVPSLLSSANLCGGVSGCGSGRAPVILALGAPVVCELCQNAGPGKRGKGQGIGKGQREKLREIQKKYENQKLTTYEAYSL